mgnify:CR=1 FL=1
MPDRQDTRAHPPHAGDRQTAPQLATKRRLNALIPVVQSAFVNAQALNPPCTSPPLSKESGSSIHHPIIPHCGAFGKGVGCSKIGDISHSLLSVPPAGRGNRTDWVLLTPWGGTCRKGQLCSRNWYYKGMGTVLSSRYGYGFRTLSLGASMPYFRTQGFGGEKGKMQGTFGIVPNRERG